MTERPPQSPDAPGVVLVLMRQQHTTRGVVPEGVHQGVRHSGAPRVDQSVADAINRKRRRFDGVRRVQHDTLERPYSCSLNLDELVRHGLRWWSAAATTG